MKKLPDASFTDAPFTDSEVVSINQYQRTGVFHPFTCGNEHDGRHELYATAGCLRCPNCAWRQTWCHSFMADFSWEKAASWTVSLS
jgi:hypothetical protein